MALTLCFKLTVFTLMLCIVSSGAVVTLCLRRAFFLYWKWYDCVSFPISVL